MKKLQRVLALIMAIVMMMGTMSMTAFATEGGDTTAPVISQRIEKTADGLDENDQTNVTLTVPGEKIEMSSDIVLIVGEGSALKHEYFVELLHDMLTAADGTPTKIKVGLVTFGDTTEQEIVLPLSEMIDTVPGNTVKDFTCNYPSQNKGESRADYLERIQPDLDAYEANIAAAVAENPAIANDMDFLIARALHVASLYSNGVNLKSALITARDMLLADTEVPAERKHMIVFSTGLTYTFDNEDGNFSVTVREQNAGGKAQFVNFKYWQSQRHNSTSGGYKIPAAYVNKHTVDGVADYKAAYLEYWGDIVEWIKNDQNAYVYTPGTIDENGDFVGDTFTAFSSRLNKDYLLQGSDLSKVSGKAPFANGKNPLTDAAAQHAVGYERAQYEAYLVYKQMETPIGQNVTSVLKDEDGNNYVYPGLGFNCYALAAGKTAAMDEDDLWLQENQIGYNFMFMMGGENAANFRSGDATFFKNIASKILYTCADDSTVTDYMGYDEVKGDFNFVQDPTTMTLVYGGETYTAEQIATKEGATASYGFNKKDDGTYSFNLDYYAGEADAEHFIWTFHENVSMEKIASLTYKLQLTGKADEAGEYTIETNEYAVLKPIDTKQQAGDWQYFPVPTVDYKVSAKVTISGVKEWNDDEDRDGKRPESIKVILLANGEPVAEKVLTSADAHWTHEGTWTFEFKDMPAKDANGTIKYTVDEELTEEDAKNYTKSVEGFVIENTHTPETIDISGKKVWNDDSNRDGKRPASITVNVMNGTKVAATKTVTGEGNEWTYEFTGLYKYENGQEIEYTIVEIMDEVADEAYETVVDGTTITNTYEPETIDISGKKVWDDANNQDGKRPASIKVILNADGEKVAEQTVTGEGNEWAFEFKDLPKNKNVNGVISEIEYTVAEIEVPQGYQSIPGENNTITNKYTPGKISVTVTKKWLDASNQDGVRPEEITIILKADGEKVAEQTVTGEGDTWTSTFTDLPEYKNGKLIKYTVDEGDEAEAAGYTKSISGTTITNSRNVELTSVSGKKVWDDNNNQDGIRPDSIKVVLKADGEQVAEQTVTGRGNEWTFEFAGLPKFKNGETIEYTVAEIEVEGYNSNVEGTTITNTQKQYASVTVSGKKVWEDGNDQDGLRPEAIEVVLYADGVEVDRVSTNKELDNWTFKFENLPANKDGEAIVYTVDEAEVPAGYTKSVSGTTITNTHTPATVTVSGKKVWDDKNNQDGLRPESITINLLADGVEKDSKTVTAADGWEFAFEALPKYEDGVEIVYTVTEDAVIGYNAPAIAGSVEGGFTVTNTHTPATVAVEGSKTWNDANDQDGKRPESITIRLLADGVEKDSKTVTAADGWTWSWTNLPKFANGVEIRYTITEDAVEDYSTDINGYNVTNSYTPGKTSVTVTKAWSDANNQDGIRPDSVTVKLLAGGQETGKTVELNAGNNWTYTFTELAKMAAGQDIIYTVAEVGVEGYEPEIVGDATSGYTITNTHTPETVDVTGIKVWEDYNDLNGFRPESITIKLMVGGEVIDRKTVTAADGWEFAFVALPKYKGGVEIVYTITEDKVAWYEEPVITGSVEDGFTVINTYDSPDISEPEETPTVYPPMGMPSGDDYIILDEDVPLADVPKTGDPLAVMAAISALSGAGLFLTRKKREDEE